jgi:hypothetical protein
MFIGMMLIIKKKKSKITSRGQAFGLESRKVAILFLMTFVRRSTSTD